MREKVRLDENDINSIIMAAREDGVEMELPSDKQEDGCKGCECYEECHGTKESKYEDKQGAEGITREELEEKIILALLGASSLSRRGYVVSSAEVLAKLKAAAESEMAKNKKSNDVIDIHIHF